MNEQTEKRSLRRSWKTSGPVAKLTVVFAGIAALATVTYAGITGWQLHLMSGQLRALLESNEINREALYSVQRAFVAAQKYTSELATYTDNDKTGKPVTVVETTAHWENIGNTPAIDVRMMFGSLQQKDDELSKEQFVGLNLIGSASLTTSAIAPKVIFDAGPIRQREEWFFEKSDTPMRWFYWGWMVYKDIFPKTKTHVTEFCLRVNEIKWKVSSNGKPIGKPYFSATTCAQHNCMDDFCKDYATIVQTAEGKSALNESAEGRNNMKTFVLWVSVISGLVATGLWFTATFVKADYKPKTASAMTYSEDGRTIDVLATPGKQTKWNRWAAFFTGISMFAQAISLKL